MREWKMKENREMFVDERWKEGRIKILKNGMKRVKRKLE
jgi:hypothetical protein